MSIKFLLYIMKKKIKQPIEDEMLQLLEENNYTPLEEWKGNGNIQRIDNSDKNSVKGDGSEQADNATTMEI